MDYNFVFNHISERVKALPPVDAGHAFDHTWRVVQEAERLFKAEWSEKSGNHSSDSSYETELWALKFAALLHDCVPLPKNSPLRKESARLCAETAEAWLGEAGIQNPKLIELVFGAIEDHSFSSGRIPRTLVGKCLQDADRLEAIGAIGLYRCIATGVAMGAQLFDPEDPWAERRALDDKKFSVDHFFTKLLKLPATFQTKAGRLEADQRAKFLMLFVNQLKAELNSL